MDEDIRKSSIPSNKLKLFQIIRNQTLCKLIRFSWWESSDAMEQCEIAEEDVFSLTAGPVLMYFQSGLVIGAASDPAQNSVIIWIEKDDTGYITDEPIENDTELYSISALDKQYSNSDWNQIVGQRISMVNIIKREPHNALLAELPNEVGIEMVMENEKKFIMSHGLHNNSDDFSVITESYIDRKLLQNLRWTTTRS
ncbi:hypothetical protein GCM10010912_27760 [Paenibacillus albidus]|uniref:Uncharacterized protein n=1 Tax=Paenibacillus albidus TaxID=2041023 RepID=A0A917CBB3_9BACL|nr:hypothetical protein [Paenibacillus albidus]GGF81101.1 hypothetical protein GCM10010912_27760 [Paenibacillus albidus]